MLGGISGRLWAAEGRHGGGTPPALRAARLRRRVAQLTKVWPPGVPLMQKKRGNPGENANQGLTRGSEVPIIFLCPSKGGGSAPFYPKGRRPLNAAGISPKKRREAP